MEKKRLVGIALFIFIIGFYYSLSFADIIKLKSGKQFEGDIVERTDEHVKVRVGGITITYPLARIESVEEEKRIDYEYGKVDPEENAAKYYLRADALMVFPRPEIKQLEKEIEDIIRNGWQKKHKKLEEILKANEPFFAEIKKGVALKKCDFQFGKEYNSWSVKEPIRITKVTHWLLLLKGRYYERQGNFNEAVDLYLSSLTLAQHVSQDYDTIPILMATCIEKDSYIPLRACLDLELIDEKITAKISDYLDNYEQQHFPIKGLIEQEKDFFISALHKVSVQGKEKAEKEFKSDNEKKEAMYKFYDEYMIQGRELAYRYFGYYIKAAETNKKSDLEYALKQWEALQRSADPGLVGNIKDYGQLLFNAHTGKTEEAVEQIIEKILTILLSAWNPMFFAEVIDDYHANLRELRDLKSLARIRRQAQ